MGGFCPLASSRVDKDETTLELLDAKCLYLPQTKVPNATTPDSVKSERPMPNWVFSPKFPLEAKFVHEQALFNTR